MTIKIRRGLLVVVLLCAAGAKAGTQYVIDERQVRPLRESTRIGERLTLRVPLEDGAPRELALERFTVWSPDAEVTIFGDRGTVLQRVAPPRTEYFRGTVAGDPLSTVFVTRDGMHLGGFVITATGRRFGIGERSPDGRLTAVHPLYIEERTVADTYAAGVAPFRCEEPVHPLSPDEDLKIQNLLARPPVEVTASANGTRVLKLAMETDYELYTALGSNATAVSTFIGNLVAAGSIVYRRDLATELLIGHTSVYTSAADPYSAADSGSALREVGDVFHGASTTYSGPIPYTGSRSAAVFVSGKNFGGGVAWLQVVGYSDFLTGGHWAGAFAVCGSVSDATLPNPNQHPDYTVDSSMALHAWALYVFVHELGHNVQSPHTHCITMPPASQTQYGRATVDRCWGAESGASCYAGAGSLPTEAPQHGTIMSYCHQLDGGYSNLRYTFGQPTDGSAIVPVNMTSGLAQVSPGISSLTGPSSLAPGGSGTASVVATAAPNVGGADTFTYTWTVTNGSINSGQGTAAIQFTAASNPVTVKVLVINSRGVGFSDFITVPVSGGGNTCASVVTQQVTPPQVSNGTDHGSDSARAVVPAGAELPPGGVWRRQKRDGGETWTYQFTIEPAAKDVAPAGRGGSGSAVRTGAIPGETSRNVTASMVAVPRTADAPRAGSLLQPRFVSDDDTAPRSSPVARAGRPAAADGVGMAVAGATMLAAHLGAPMELARANAFDARFEGVPADGEIASARVFVRISHPDAAQLRVALSVGGRELLLWGEGDPSPGTELVLDRIVTEDLRGIVPSSPWTIVIRDAAGVGILQEAWIVATAARRTVEPGVISNATLDIAAQRAYLRTESAQAGSEVATPSLGQTVYFHSDYQVLGTGTAFTMTLRAHVDGVVSCSGSGSVTPGFAYSSWCNGGWVATAGTHTLQWDFDYFNAVAETNESNNSVARSFTPAASVDVVAAAAYLRTAEAQGGSEVAQPTVGQTVYFHGDTYVTGSGNAFDLSLRARLDGSVFCSGNFSAAPGGSYTTWCNGGWVATTGSHTLQWDYDYTNSVAETSEGNNSVAKSISPSGIDIAATRAYLRTATAGGGSEVEQPVAGQVVYFYADSQVSGSGSTVAVSQRALLDGSVFCSFVGSMAPGGGYYSYCNGGWTATAGTHTLQWDFDYTNEIPETNESNNSTAKTISPTGSVDLAATRAYLRTAAAQAGTEVTQPSQGQNVFFHADYQITGSGSAVTVTYRALLDGAAFCSGSASQSPGAYVAWCTGGWPATAGSHTLEWQLDYGNAVAETNESNNSASKAITTQSGALDIAAQRAYLRTGASGGGSEVAQPNTGQQVWFHGNFQVTGSGGAITVTQRAVLDGAVFCTCQTTATPGTSYISSCSQSWTATQGSHNLTWELDPGNAVAESNESNNSASVSFNVQSTDTTPPTGALLINSGATYTRLLNVSLQLTASDTTGVAGYFVSNGSTTPTAGQGGWTAVTPTTSLNLTTSWNVAAGDGSKTVYAWYKDAAGNVSTTKSDAITLDQTAPVNGTLTATAGNQQVTLNWSGQSDATSGVAGYKLVFATGTTPPANCTGTVIATTSPYTHTGRTNGQPYAYRLCTTDNATNVSAGATATATPTGAPTGARVRGDFNADGKADIFWRNTSTGETSLWTMNGATFSAAVRATTIATSFLPAVMGDFDGDARTDIYWRNASTGQSEVWLGWNGTAFATRVAGLTVATAWVPSGAGDLNGDGKADIFWRNTSTGQTSVWFMNGARYASTAVTSTVPMPWTPAAFGDFDADGKMDVLWRQPSTGETSVWLGWNGTTFATQVRTATSVTAWIPVGGGDINGDGRADVFWRNNATGETRIWFMNGAAFTNVASTRVPLAWLPTPIADFSGDTRSDIYWRNATTGETSVWLGWNGAAFATQVAGRLVTPTTWTPVGAP